MGQALVPGDGEQSRCKQTLTNNWGGDKQREVRFSGRIHSTACVQAIAQLPQSLVRFLENHHETTACNCVLHNTQLYRTDT